MTEGLRLMCVLAHPDDESLGMGGTLAKYAAEGVETFLVTATRGERGRYGDLPERPSLEEVGVIREGELRAAARVLGIREVSLLGYLDGDLDQMSPEEVIRRIAYEIRRLRPHVVVTFGPDGAYGHPDHIAISQFTTAALMVADSEEDDLGLPSHGVSKLYYMAWTKPKWDAYQSAFRELAAKVDGSERRAVPWPEWAVTTVINTEEYWPTVWKAVTCHQTQMALYGKLEHLSSEHHKALWGSQEFYRAMSRVNGGRGREVDLFEGIKPTQSRGVPAAKQRDTSSGIPERTSAVSEKAGPSGQRCAPLKMSSEQFRRLGHDLVDRIARFLDSLSDRPVTRAASPQQIQSMLSAYGPLPEEGTDAAPLLARVAEELFDYSLHNGHPRFWGYITSSASPIGMLGDFLAASVNANAGAWHIAPVATEIELETVRWIAQLLGYPATCGGVLVSGGNIANIAGFLAARRAQADWNLRKEGVSGRRMRAYASTETHTWIQKAADLSGLGTDAIRWIAAGTDQRINTTQLIRQIEEDRGRGDLPFLIVGNAGTVSTGAVDPLEEMATIAREQGLWFHVDGAYGAPAAMVPDLSSDLAMLGRADSLAVDPHKWLYAPLEAGCILVRDPQALRDAFSFHPPYYHFDPEKTNYFDYGLQNSRGFRALKVWLALRQVGRSGYREMIQEDVRLSRELYRRLEDFDELERVTQNLSIATFRFVPKDLRGRTQEDGVREYLNTLNQRILTRIEEGGEIFLSNAMLEDRFVLRMCIVNFRTSLEDVGVLPEAVVRYGRAADRELRAGGILEI